MKKQFMNRIPSLLKNFYVITGLVFLTWMLVFDSNNYITQIKLSSKQKNLEETKEYYLTKIEEVRKDREALLSNEKMLEKIAREKYYMKREKEDVFVIVNE